jgi:hypothetical protein
LRHLAKLTGEGKTVNAGLTCEMIVLSSTR